ncbi:hypothetical protein [Streptomyces sp. 2P-4]|uniref:hypothetical protein n=1 Tax=Streptomyces sp. 2P-4 TaxID=2931974 RepID=UPI002541D2D8|nr:hypothetical protein [Streptomyces sp. 2P-4]
MAARRSRAAAAAAVAGVLASLTAGCGIRATTVPVDVGPAPSRVSCDIPAQQGGAQGFRATVELVCGSQLVGVERIVPMAAEKKPARTAALAAAEALLAALEREPGHDEREAGFTTSVPNGLTVAPLRAADPAGTVRLSRKPEDLPPVALAQVVCTFAGNKTVSAGPGPVVLGGPDSDPPRAWECTDAVRARPESVPTLGELVRPVPSAATPAPTPTG